MTDNYSNYSMLPCRLLRFISTFVVSEGANLINRFVMQENHVIMGALLQYVKVYVLIYDIFRHYSDVSEGTLLCD